MLPTTGTSNVAAETENVQIAGTMTDRFQTATANLGLATTANSTNCPWATAPAAD